MYYDLNNKWRMSAELMQQKTGSVSPFTGSAEKRALKQAKKAEQEFRKSKGYPPDTFWYRLKKRFLQK